MISDNNKKIAKNTLLLYVRMIILLFVGLFTSRVILDSLGTVDYGIYNVVGGFVTMFNVFKAGVTTSTQRFITYDLGKGDLKELNITFSTCVIIFFLISFVILFVSEIGGIWFLENKMVIPCERFVAARWVFQLSLITLLIGLISTPYNALIISHEQMGAFAYISIYEAVSKLLISYLIYISSFDKLIVYAILLCLVQISVRFMYSIYCERKFPESKFHFILDRERIKKIFGFTGWTFLGGISLIARTQGLNIMLNMFFGPTVNAARGVAVQIEHAVNGFVHNFQTSLTPQIVKSYANGDLNFMYALVCRSSKFSYYLMLFFCLPIVIEIDMILNVWLKQVPNHTASFVRLMFFISMIDAISNPLIRSIEATGKIRFYQLIVGLLMILILPISYSALYFGGNPEVVYMISFFVSFVAFLLRLYITSRQTGLSSFFYFNEVITKIFFVTFLSVIPPLILHFYLPFGLKRLLLVVFISICTLIICIFYVGLSVYERKTIVQYVKRKFIF